MKPHSIGGLEVDAGSLVDADGNNISDANIQMGSWRDSTCDWCKLYWCTVCCPLISMGQVMTRMNLDAMGSPRRNPGMSACKILSIVTAALFGLKLVFVAIVAAAASEPDSHDNDSALGTSYLLVRLSGIAIGLYLFLLVLRTRTYIRSRYRIREECCIGCEDCCCAWFCSLCAIVQMSRHTADFHTQSASLFTETGLEDRNSFV